MLPMSHNLRHQCEAYQRHYATYAQVNTHISSYYIILCCFIYCISPRSSREKANAHVLDLKDSLTCYTYTHNLFGDTMLSGVVCF